MRAVYFRRMCARILFIVIESMKMKVGDFVFKKISSGAEKWGVSRWRIRQVIVLSSTMASSCTIPMLQRR